MNSNRLGRSCQIKSNRVFSKERKFAFEVANQILRNEKVRKRIVKPSFNPTVHVYFEEQGKEQEERIVVRQERPRRIKEKKLTPEEKIEILNKIAGSGQKFSPEHIKESLDIANRDDWD